MRTGDVQGSSLSHAGALGKFGLLDGEIDWLVDTDGSPVVLGGFDGVEEAVCKDCVRLRVFS